MTIMALEHHASYSQNTLGFKRAWVAGGLSF